MDERLRFVAQLLDGEAMSEATGDSYSGSNQPTASVRPSLNYYRFPTHLALLDRGSATDPL